MVFIKYLICVSFCTLIPVIISTDPKVPFIYAQDYCHYSTVNHKVHMKEDFPLVVISAYRDQYRPDLECQFRIVNKGSKQFGLNININYIKLKHSPGSKDYLTIKFNKNNANLWFQQRLIDNNNKNEEFFSTSDSDNSDEVVFKFHTTAHQSSHSDKDIDFEIVVTLFEFEDRNRRGISKNYRQRDESCVYRNLFDCGNNICIKRKHFCDGFQNCGNGRDEPDNCKHSRNNNYFDLFDSGFWFGFKIVMSLLLIGILLGIMSCICKKYDENAKLKKQFLFEELRRHSGYRLRGNSIVQNRTPLYPHLYRTYGATDS